MKSLFGSLIGLVAGAIVVSCATGAPDDVEDSEATARDSAAITSTCTDKTIGLPCDPDGSMGPLLECQGVCAIATNGYVSCLPLSRVGLSNLDGRTCGTSAGVGDAACTHVCLGKGCVAANAAAGSACRPKATSNACDGQCNGAGKCMPLAAPCAFGRDSCTFNTCNFSKASECLIQNLPAKTECSVFDACIGSACDGKGNCNPGATRSCDDGNSCTDDVCDPKTGACIGVANDKNGCDDGNACTVGDRCEAGRCVAPTPVDCADTDPCTVDSCNKTTGCVHTPKNCDDKNACTVDSCSATNGACLHSPLNCDDKDPCTVDSCDILTGCKHEPIDCDDKNACTTDSCKAGVCQHAPRVCNDGNACTSDSCAPASGCVFAPISGCGSGGSTSGGNSGGAAGEGDGGTNSGGTDSSSGGTDSASGGAPDAGAAGAVGEMGGSTGSGGTPGETNSGGSTALGGKMGAGGALSGGSATTAQGGDVATGGASSAQGGSTNHASGGASKPASGGSSATSGSTGTGAGPMSDPGPILDGSEDSNCSCRVAGAPSSGNASSLWLLLALAALRRRRAS